MRNLRKLFYVACAVFFFTSCEETYNDKLFWPGEISQEYGSYIKPYTLDLTYSGEKLVGKTVSFKTGDSETGTLTLNDVIPGEKETPISHIQLYENEEKGYYTNAYLARIAQIEAGMTQKQEDEEIERAIDEIVSVNPLGIYKKVKRDIPFIY